MGGEGASSGGAPASALDGFVKLVGGWMGGVGSVGKKGEWTVQLPAPGGSWRASPPQAEAPARFPGHTLAGSQGCPPRLPAPAAAPPAAWRRCSTPRTLFSSCCSNPGHRPVATSSLTRRPAAAPRHCCSSCGRHLPSLRLLSSSCCSLPGHHPSFHLQPQPAGSTVAVARGIRGGWVGGLRQGQGVGGWAGGRAAEAGAPSWGG